MSIVIMITSCVFLFCFCYKHAIDEYNKEVVFFYRIAQSHYIKDEIKAIAVFWHKRCFSFFLWIQIFFNIFMLPLSKKTNQSQQDYSQKISKRELKIILFLILKSLKVNITFLFPLYIVVFIFGLLWLFMWGYLFTLKDYVLNMVYRFYYLKQYQRYDMQN